MRFFTKPRGILGLRFGADAAEAAARTNLRCEEWRPWEGGEGFDTCSDIASPVEAFGAQATIRLIRKNGKLEAVELTFRNCAEAWDRLSVAVASELHLNPADDTGIYQVWRSGEVVHLAPDRRDNTCTLTVGGAEFGTAFQSYQLRLGLAGLGSSMRPR